MNSPQKYGKRNAKASKYSKSSSKASKARGSKYAGASTYSDEETNAEVALEDVVIGCKLYVFKDMGANDSQYRKAEILSIRELNLGSKEFYVHYSEFNKRLDEWVTADRLDLKGEIEFPKSKKIKTVSTTEIFTPTKVMGSSTAMLTADSPEKIPLKKRRETDLQSHFSASASSNASPQHPLSHQINESAASSPSSSVSSSFLETPRDNNNNKRKAIVEDTPMTIERTTFSKEKELERLRTSGSMTQCVAEISRVRNLNRLQIGRHIVEPWYFSPYPKQFAHQDMTYICEFCLFYFRTQTEFGRHRAKCKLKHPPGKEIYHKEDISFWEVDGHIQKTYVRNLCLLSKCFLDHKTLYYDVDPFLFYIMTKADSSGCHLIGYFSKEKQSPENYNVACILTLPQHQRMGYGKVLIQFSYELSKVEGKLGSPEKPLSDLGLLSYRAYWAEKLIELLGEYRGEISIEDISTRTSVTHLDVLHTLQHLGALRYYKGQHIICWGKKHIENFERAKNRAKIVIDPTYLKWSPPQFLPSQLRFV